MRFGLEPPSLFQPSSLSILVSVHHISLFFSYKNSLKKKPVLYCHSRLSKNLMKIKSLCMGPSQGEKALLGGPKYLYLEILAYGAQIPTPRQLSKSYLQMVGSMPKLLGFPKTLNLDLQTVLLQPAKVPSTGFNFYWILVQPTVFQTPEFRIDPYGILF